MEQYEERMEMEGLYVCDLCESTFEARKALIEHCKDAHGYD